MWKRILAFMMGGALGMAAGFALGIFAYPYIFLADIVAMEEITDADSRPVVATGMVAAHVVDEVDEVVLVLGRRRVVDHVVPALEPHEARELGRELSGAGKALVELRQCLAVLGEHHLVVGADRAARAGWPEILPSRARRRQGACGP